ncbi:MAG: hypothetical protein AABX79_00495 [Nanoarchaeota archaeon]
MKIDSDYTSPTFLGLETSVTDTYRTGIERLRKSEDAQEQLTILSEMFDSLGKSHSGSNGVGWAKDRMLMYHNLGKILGKVSGTPREYSYWLYITSKYSGVESVKNALEKLKGIEEILKTHNIVNDSELKEKLVSTPLQEIILEYADLLNDYRTGDKTDSKSIKNALERLKDISCLLMEYGVDTGVGLTLDLEAKLKMAEEAESLEKL